ncbi:type II toxin-antitoxin system PemK/MazF family toxin [Taurinivorans muris]|jgi:Growth inhibitor|uniref:mRNA interferase n=1 Tax=Taurinivorans muris TaxID=2787751 RepID=A0ABY5Y0P7_9BACT|nr:type II toxin-antitoxin system PemK/MazF family toxin [Desulfovibrionaceae bacterium LT0009]
MLKQGDIIKVNFNPQKGHEQAGYRPAVIISNDFFNAKTNLAIVCPITNTDNKFPLHIPLQGKTKTTGVILCEHVKTLDLNARQYSFVEKLPKELLKQVIDIVFSEIEY